MSTSILVKKMQEAAQKKSMDAKIWAAPASQLHDFINEVDVILLGPQVRYLLSDIQKQAEPYGVPVDTVNPMHYGTVNGEAVIEHVLTLKK
jgi:PTS system cellobiose-specific IIB component